MSLAQSGQTAARYLREVYLQHSNYSFSSFFWRKRFDFSLLLYLIPGNTSRRPDVNVTCIYFVLQVKDKGSQGVLLHRINERDGGKELHNASAETSSSLQVH